MKKTTIGITITVLILVGVIWLARPDSGASLTASLAPNSSEVIGLEETNYDFGAIRMSEGDVSHEFRVKNKGFEPIIIQKIYTSCMCTTASLSLGGKSFGPYGMPGHGVIPKVNETLFPAEEAVINVVFDPAAHGPSGVGKIQRTVRVETSVGLFDLGFSALVTP